MTLLTRKTGEQDSGNVGMVNPCLHVDGTWLVIDNNNVGRDIGDREHKLITRMPSSQVPPVSNVAIDINVFFSAIAVEEHHGDVGSSRGADRQVVIKVIERPRNEGLVHDSTSLDGLEGRDQVGEFGST